MISISLGIHGFYARTLDPKRAGKRNSKNADIRLFATKNTQDGQKNAHEHEKKSYEDEHEGEEIS